MAQLYYTKQVLYDVGINYPRIVHKIQGKQSRFFILYNQKIHWITNIIYNHKCVIQFSSNISLA